MGVAFFSTLAFCAGGSLVHRVRKNLRRRKILQRYATRLAALLEKDESVLEAFRRDPEKIILRKRRLCGKTIEIELRVFPEPERILHILVSEPDSFLNNRFPAGAHINLERKNLRMEILKGKHSYVE